MVAAMRGVLICLVLIGGLWLQPQAMAASGRVIKVLPEYVDLKGRTSLTPSLYDRDAYQAILRDHPERRSGVRFFVQWKTKGLAGAPLKVRVELRGSAEGNLPKRTTLEEPLTPKGGWFSHWTTLNLEGEAYKRFGGVVAWRVTLWEGSQLLSQQASFLW